MDGDRAERSYGIMVTTNDAEHERLMNCSKVALANTIQQMNIRGAKLTADLATAQSALRRLLASVVDDSETKDAMIEGVEARAEAVRVLKGVTE